MHETLIEFPRSLSAYPSLPGQSLLAVLLSRIEADPFNAVATAIFALAVLHTFVASWFTGLAHRVQHHHDEQAAAQGLAPRQSVKAGLLHFLGEVEVVFGLWTIPADHRDHRRARLDDRDALRQRHGQLHRAVVRGRDHGAGVDAADRDAGRIIAAQRRAARRAAHLARGGW